MREGAFALVTLAIVSCATASVESHAYKNSDFEEQALGGVTQAFLDAIQGRGRMWVDAMDASGRRAIAEQLASVTVERVPLSPDPLRTLLILSAASFPATNAANTLRYLDSPAETLYALKPEFERALRAHSGPGLSHY